METKRVRLTGRLQRQGRIKHPDFKKYGVREILDNLTEACSKDKINFDGTLVGLSKSKYRVFEKSHVCAKCGLEAQYFILEKHGMWMGKGNVYNISNEYRFHLMAVRGDGSEVEFTQDHILPKTLGGINNLINYQTMCMDCNSRKGHKVEERDLKVMSNILKELEIKHIPHEVRTPFHIKLIKIVNKERRESLCQFMK